MEGMFNTKVQRFKGARNTGRVGFILGVWLLLAFPAVAQGPLWKIGYKEALRKIQARITELRQENGFPGVNVGLVMPDGRSMTVSLGYADAEAQRPLKASDRMLAGSIGKTFVAGVTLLAVEEGKLELEDKIEKWLGHEPWFDRLPNARSISLQMLMNHTSGIPEHVLRADFLKAVREQPDKVWKPEELIAYIFDEKPLFEAGKGWSYADTNYILVGMIFERATGRTVYGEVTRRILGPLKLRETAPSDSRLLTGLIPGYVSSTGPFGFEGRNLLADGRFVINPQMEWCGGGFVSTAEDLARWAKAMYEGKVLRTVLFDSMLEAVPAKTGPNDKYGLGVMVRETPWGTTYGHGGIFPGYLSDVQYFPKYKTAVAIQFNTDDRKKLGHAPRWYVTEVARILFGDASSQPLPQ